MSNINKLFLLIRVYFELGKFYFLDLIIYTQQNVCVHPEKKINLKIIFYFLKCLFINSIEKLRQTTIEISYAWRNVKTLICQLTWLTNWCDRYSSLVIIQKGKNHLIKPKWTLRKQQENLNISLRVVSTTHCTFFEFVIFVLTVFYLQFFFFYKCTVISISNLILKLWGKFKQAGNECDI